MMGHPGGWKTFYCHLSRISVEPQQLLDTGDILGLAGSSGAARSSRLHFALFKNGEPLDPLDYLY